MKKGRLLEGIQPTGKKAVYLEIAGGTPLLPQRREILLKAKIVTVQEGKSITINIPLKHIVTVSETPVRGRRSKREILIRTI